MVRRGCSNRRSGRWRRANCRDALKDAKVCYRQQNSPESRRLLERAYLARGRQLYGAGLRGEACAVIESLLELRVTDGRRCSRNCQDC